MNTIDTDKFSEALRAKAIRVSEGKLLIARLAGSRQESDLSEPPNCGGFGRIHHFRRQIAPGWPENPLPQDPAAHRLEKRCTNNLNVQVFQSGTCNWRCWYCYVPFEMLAADETHSSWMSATDLLDLYEKLPDRSPVIDLTGGQPDLTPEWVPWMMRELRSRGLEASTYLWSDDNLSTDYFWRYLSRGDIDFIQQYRNYGKVCCFKGFDSQSFTFNTRANPDLFDRQFTLFARYLKLGVDLYAYVSFTSPYMSDVAGRISTFVDRLQAIHPNLPLRTVPLKIRSFEVTAARNVFEQKQALEVQQQAVESWLKELEIRYTEAERKRPIYDNDLTE